jgi:hypothetical protein
MSASARVCIVAACMRRDLRSIARSISSLEKTNPFWTAPAPTVDAQIQNDGRAPGDLEESLPPLIHHLTALKAV